MFEQMDLSTVPGHLNLRGVQAAATRLLDQLEAEERVDGGMVCRF